MYIADQDRLEAFVERSSNARVLAIDTEFLREKTYYARLCLLQMATEHEVAIIDPFTIKDLKAITPLLENEKIVKLFHAGSQDIEILFRETGVLPRPVFDTQIAATLLGYTQQIGYAPLVSSECNVQLRKMESFTDWSRRPLSASQLDYAADDVVYLPPMYEKMQGRLAEKSRLAWLEQDFGRLVDPATYVNDSNERFRKLKRVTQLSRRQLSAAKEFTAWRERVAQERDLPRKWVVTDEQIVEACKREARTLDSLFMVRGLKDKLDTESAREVVSRINKGLDAPNDAWPELERSKKNERNVDIEMDLMNALVKLRARENDIAYQTLASHDDLQKIARGYTKDVQLLTGWRYDIVGKELLDVLAGKISLALRDGTLQIADISE